MKSKNFLKQIELELKKDGLWNERRLECIGGLSDIALKYVTKDKAFAIPETELFLQEPEDLALFLYKFGTSPEIRYHSIRTDRSNIKTSSSVLCASAWDLKHSHLKDLFNAGFFDEKESQSETEQHEQKLLKTTAYLTLCGISTENELERILPVFRYKTFHTLRAKVHRIVEMTFPKTMRRLENALNTLTPAQKQALKLVRFEDDGKRTQNEVASQIGISVASLKDRLNGAIKKITEEFSEWVPSDQNRPAYWANLFDPKDSEYWGLYRKSEAKRIYPVYKIFPGNTTIRTEIKMPAKRPKNLTAQLGIAEKKDWIKKTSYIPSHDGVFSPKLAHMKNIFLEDKEKESRQSTKYRINFYSGNPKAVYDDFKSQDQQARMRQKAKNRSEAEDDEE